MRRRSKAPIKRKYFHKRPKIDDRDTVFLKKKIGIIKQKKQNKDLEKK